MDLNEYLETIVEFNKEKPYGIIVAQFVFDSFRKYAIDYLQDPNKEMFESLYDLVIEYTDESFKKYVDEIFQDENYIQFDTKDLCLEFFKNFITHLDSIIAGDDKNEDIITDFLDFNIYKFFEIMLYDNAEFWFFPYSYEDELHLDTYELLRSKLTTPKKSISSELLNEPIGQIEQTPVKSLTRAVIKNKHKLTKKHLSFKATMKTRKLIHK